MSTAQLPSKWPWIAALWIGIGLFDATQTVVVMRAAGMHHAWLELYLDVSLAWLPWALATPLILSTTTRHAQAARGGPTALAWGAHVATWLVVGLGSDLWMAVLDHVLNPWTPDLPAAALGGLLSDKVYDHVLSSLILYGCIAMAGHMLDQRDRLARERVASAQLAGQLVKAQLDALRHQLEPHFLFNALNAVTGLIREGRPEQAVEAIARVSDFLRHLLEDVGHQEVSLEEELRFAELYLEIQKVRLGDRLRVAIDVAPGLGQAIVPRLILQPLVENAIKHGIAMRSQPGAIEIAASRHDEQLVLTLYNDGRTLPAEAPPPGASIGLANVRRRLRGLHGDAASLAIANVEQRGVRVTLSLPLRALPCPA